MEKLTEEEVIEKYARQVTTPPTEHRESGGENSDGLANGLEKDLDKFPEPLSMDHLDKNSFEAVKKEMSVLCNDTSHALEKRQGIESGYEPFDQEVYEGLLRNGMELMSQQAEKYELFGLFQFY
uniref:Peroxin-19 n=1 Tax=Ditylenchus dipsaci TaxID=166011 RepID=A0A915CQG8_9BILA